MRVITCTAALAVAALALGAGRAEEKSLLLDQVPAKAREAADKAAKGVKLSEAFVEVEEGRKVFELRGKNAEGKRLEIDVTAEGQVLEIETEVTLDSVPEPVRKALKEWVKDFKPHFVERSQRPDGDATSAAGGREPGAEKATTQGGSEGNLWYEFEGKDAQNRNLEVEIRADGMRILIELDDDADDEKGAEDVKGSKKES